ncbi:hypothetical protein [Streptomyces sp. SP18CS02]|uniref:hypothetical protein n=1 Tax=Streptomyces sp. SP18CS02 TaxID=3002531 RepID=UPI002E792F87|nr:hypothetical protein [Streptomyces sp. SP18CS02]MEE1751857.1 hypothetical protein [Streptomyces sp. SP18CS02]
MSATGAGGPALFLGTGTDYVALVRPELDPTQPDIVRAAADAGVTPEEFAGSGDVWAVLVEHEGGGDGFELPGVRDSEPAGFAERLRAELAAASAPGAEPRPFTVDGGAVLRLDARPAGAGAFGFEIHVIPPDGGEGDALTVRTGPLPVAGLLADLDAFLGSLA